MNEVELEGQRQALRRTFQRIAQQDLPVPNNFGRTLKGAVNLGLTTVDSLADTLGVNDQHVFKKANSMPDREIVRFCRKLNLA